MNVSVFGMGYVGCVTAACLAKAGHGVIGVEVNPEKLEALQSGSVPFVEPGLSEVVAREVACGRLRSTADAMAAVQQSSLSMICVGTPSLPSGELDPLRARARVPANRRCPGRQAGLSYRRRTNRPCFRAHWHDAGRSSRQRAT